MGLWSWITGRQPAGAAPVQRHALTADAARGGWLRDGGPNAPRTTAATLGAAQVRRLVRTNPYASRTVQVLQHAIVGLGVRPSIRVVDDAGREDVRLSRLYRDRWAAFVETADPLRQSDFYGLQSLAVRSMIESGDVLARPRMRRATDGLAVPLQLQVLEIDHLDTSRTMLRLGVGGAATYGGIELDPIGRPSRYWLYPHHPQDGVANSSVAIDAAEVIHMRVPVRPGALRGQPWLTPAAPFLRDIADLMEAVQTRARTEAALAVFVRSPEQPAAPLAGGTAEDGTPIDSITPGTVAYLRPGEEVEFLTPTGTAGAEPLMVRLMQAAAVGSGATYDQMTGDTSQANYSSSKVGHMPHRRLVEYVQHQVLVPQFCKPVFREFLRALEFTDPALDVPAANLRVSWFGPAHESIDPVKDMTADLSAVRSGRMTVDEFAASWGNDPATHWQDVAEGFARLRALGLDPGALFATGGGAPSAPDQPAAAPTTAE